MTMRVLTVAIALLMSSALIPSFAEEGKSPVPNQPQMTPVQPERTPQQSQQSREQDLKSADDVRVGRDWKAHAPSQPDTSSNQTTTGTSGAHDAGRAGGVSVAEHERKPITSPATSHRDRTPI